MEKLTKEYQNVQVQLQSLALQKLQFSQQKEEFTEAQGELEKVSGKIYQEIGGLILETTKGEAQSTLKEKLESTEMRLGIITKQYEDAAKKEQSLRQTITDELKKNPQQ